jgi:hypothetical protein
MASETSCTRPSQRVGTLIHDVLDQLEQEHGRVALAVIYQKLAPQPK